MDWKMRENKMLAILKNSHKQLADLEDSNEEDMFCPWDAENEGCVVELKYRHNHTFPDFILENEKLQRVWEKKRDDQAFLYVCADDHHIHIFNISKMVEDDYDFGWNERECNAYTHFNDHGETKRMKVVGHIKKTDAAMSIPIRRIER